MDMEHKRLTLFAGHYGSGKTNIAVNYALLLRREGKSVCIADLDIVNPYFRTKDSERELLFILAPAKVGNQIMTDINRDFGTTSPANGLVFALPTEKAFKI